MTPPVSTEALVEALARHYREDHAYLRSTADEMARTLVAGPLAPFLAALQQVTAERDRYRETHRWNIDRTGDGEVLVCRGHHDNGEDCDHERFVPEERLATANAELARLRADGEALRESMKGAVDEAKALSGRLHRSHFMNQSAVSSWLANHAGKLETALARAATAREG